MCLISLALMVVKSPPRSISIPMIRCVSRLISLIGSDDFCPLFGRLGQKQLVAQPAGTLSRTTSKTSKNRSTPSWEDWEMKKSLIKALVLALTLTAFGTVSTASAAKGSEKAPSVQKYRVNC